MKSRSIPCVSAFSFIALSSPAAFAADANLTADNGFGITSFDTATSWSDSLPPAAGKSYSTAGFMLRSPATNTASLTFAGDSLELTPRAASSGPAFLFKGTAGSQTLNFTSLILNGGFVAHGENGNNCIIAGNISVTALPSGISIPDANGRTVTITAPITGNGRLYAGAHTGSAFSNTLALSADNSGFNGGWSLGGNLTDPFRTYHFNADRTTLRVNHANALGTGTLDLHAGILNLNGFSPTGLAAVVVPDAGSATIRTAGSTLTAAAIDLGTTTGATLRIDNGGLANPAAAPLSTTTLTVNGPSTLGVLGTGLSVGTFPLISHSGSIAGPTGFGDLTLALPPGVSGNLVDNTNSLDVTISGIEFIQWTNAAATGNWNIDTDVNWKTTSGLVDTTYQQNASGGHSVLFNESEPEASPVAIVIPAAVSPNAITIHNPAKDYEFSGQAISGTAALIKDGSGSATFSNTLTFTGGMTINAGKVVVNATPSGTTAAPVAINTAAGATLEYTKETQINQGANLYSGSGTLLKTGAGTLLFDGSNSTIAMAAGGLIDVQGGKIQFGNWNAAGCTAAANQSDMHIASGAVFDGYAASVAVDKLAGSGTYQAGYFGPRLLTIGIAGGSSTFAGTIIGNGVDGNSQTQLIKRGTGTITLTGKVNARGAYGGSSVEVRGGSTASPSTLVLSPTDVTSSTGYTGGGIYISPGNADVSVLEQTAGTLTGSVIAVGEHGHGTFNLSGGTVNAGRIEFAWNGGGNNGPAVMNISDTAVLNVNNNGNILMGQYWGRAVTIHQTGGEVIQFSDTATTRGGTGRLNFFGANQNNTWNLSGGTLSIADMGWAPSGGGFGGGNGILNLNGGILQITSAAFAAPTGDANGKPKIAAKVLGDDFTPNSGARIDPYGLSVTFAAPLQHGPTSTFDGGLSVESSLPGGSLTLAGINTYTGNTTVAVDNTLVLADNAELAILVDGPDATKITGAGTANLAGDLRIDTTYADTTPETTWTIVDVATVAYDPSTFQVIGFTESSGVWTMNDGDNLWTFTESSGVLKVSPAPAGGFANWIDNFTVNDPSPGADPENDGIDNLMEYVLNGNPSLSDPAILPTLDASGANFVFQFTRRVESAADTTQVFEYGTDLTGWTPLSITPPIAAQVTLGLPAEGLQSVTVAIPKTLAAPGGRLFGRLTVVKQP
jgi:autotransporter-associated beta strand protein